MQLGRTAQTIPTAAAAGIIRQGCADMGGSAWFWPGRMYPENAMEDGMRKVLLLVFLCSLWMVIAAGCAGREAAENPENRERPTVSKPQERAIGHGSPGISGSGKPVQGIPKP